jgi:hypothetical protein
MSERENGPGHAVLRGAIIGASIGLMAGWIGFEPVKAYFMGIFCGLLAAGTKILADRAKNKKS